MRFKTRNSSGFSHVLVPLLVVVGIGVAGAFAMVSSHAAETKKTDDASKTAATTNPKATKGKSYIVAYGADKSYDQIKIVADNVDTKTHTCGGKFNSKKEVVVSLKATKQKPGAAVVTALAPTKFACSPIGGGGSQYYAYFGTKKKGFDKSPIIVETDGGYCSVLKPGEPALKRELKNGKCDTTAADAAITPIPATLVQATSVVLTSENGKITKGLVKINASDNSEATRLQCTGSARVEVQSLQTHKVVYGKDLAITFSGNKDADKGHDRCVINLKNLGYKYKESDSGATANLEAINVKLNASPYYTAPDLSFTKQF